MPVIGTIGQNITVGNTPLPVSGSFSLSNGFRNLVNFGNNLNYTVPSGKGVYINLSSNTVIFINSSTFGVNSAAYVVGSGTTIVAYSGAYNLAVFDT